MKIFKKIAVRVIPVGLLTFLIVAAIAYQRGVYDFTFIERITAADTSAQTADSVQTTLPDETQPEDSDTAETSNTPDSSSGTTASNDPEKVETDKVTDFINSLTKTNSALSSGWVVTDEVYNAGMRLTLLDPAVTVGREQSLRLKESVEYTRVPNEKYGGYTTESSTVYVDRPLVEVYMDYIIVDNGTTTALLDREGNLLYGDFDVEYYHPAYTRDSDDKAQFKALVQPTNAYGKATLKYFMIDDNGELVPSDYNDAAENRGLYINYPSYFGKSDSDYQSAYRDGSFGYSRGNAGVLSGYRYTNAFQFSEGLAATTKTDDILGVDVLSYVDTRFTNKITGSSSSWNHGPYYNLSGRRVSSTYRLPDSRGIESLGFIYFDHGLVRIRRQEYDYYHTFDSLAYDYHGHYVLCCTDEDLVMKIDGTLYDIPGGFTVKAYSDGVFLLEKDGLYGFMDYTGKWIAQPVYDYAEPFSEGLAVIGTDGKRAMIDTSGKEIVPMVFDYIQSCSGGIIAAWDEANGWNLFNKVK